jgi:hypothetical protein
MNITELTTEQLEKMLNDRRAQEAEGKNKKRKDYEALKDSTINSLAYYAVNLEEVIKTFKVKAFDELSSLYELLQEYSKRHQDGKGNFSLENADQTFKIEFARQECGYFDERANQAEKHIIDFVNSFFAKQPETKQLITNLLERKKGALDIKLVQKLYSMEDTYQDANWKQGIQLLKESWTPAETKDYIRFWRKVNGQWFSINLNFSSIKF